MARPSLKKQKARQRELQRLLRQGWLEVADERFERALRTFQQVVRRVPQHAEGWLGVGIALSALGRLEEGYKALRQSVELDPRQVEAWYTLAQVADRLGYSLEALESIRTARRLAEEQGQPPGFLQGLELTEAAIEQGLKHLAEDMGLDLSSLAEEQRALLEESFRIFNEGIRALRDKAYQQAVEAFQRAVELLPDNPRAWGNLGLALILNGQYEEAEAALQKALEIQPDYEPARLNLENIRKIREGRRADSNVFLLEYTDLKHDAPRRKELR